jgi:formamidopyrimidine-DNA glycosylase
MHLEGGRLVASRRHGKHLMARIDTGGWLTLHFGMTGGLQFVPQGEEGPPFTRVSLAFSGDGRLAYTNKRMIGRVGFVQVAEEFIAEEKLGPDALDAGFDLAAFKAALAGTRRDVKSALMDQECLAGIGNVYADEILFQAGIDPRIRIGELEPKRIERLYGTMRKVLENAITHGAGAEQFTELMPKGSLLPERHKGGRCPRCGHALEVLKIGGRTTYLCARCQT